MQLGDRELVQRVLLLNDRAAYSGLVRKYQAVIRSYLFRLTHSRETADDLAQETFLNGYRRLDQLKDHDKFRSWIYSIAHSEFLQWFRSLKTFELSGESDDVADPTDFFAGAEVRSLFKTLKPEECSALTLCLGHDFTHSEAAAALNLPLGTVKTLILRAREKIGAPA
jgi:RNA polymerase sigma factor (sigma-70 family)